MATLTIAPSTITCAPYAGYVRCVMRFPLNAPAEDKLPERIVWVVNQLRQGILEQDPAAREDHLLTTVRLHGDIGIEIRVMPQPEATRYQHEKE